MKRISLISVFIISMVFRIHSSAQHEEEIDLEYKKTLDIVLDEYPFEEWKTYFEGGLEQYTVENCENVEQIMNDLIHELVVLGKNATESSKVAKFEIAVKALNKLNDDSGYSLIETGEREQLFMLFEYIALLSGIDSSKYGAGEGIASEWRDW